MSVAPRVDAHELDVAGAHGARERLRELLRWRRYRPPWRWHRRPCPAHVVAGILGRVGRPRRRSRRNRRAPRRAADDLDPLDVLEVGLLARIGAGALVAVGEVGRAHAVDHQQHAVAADAADHEVLEAGAVRVVADRDAGLVADEIADVLHVLAIDVLGRDHGDGGRHVVERSPAAHGGGRHGVELRGNGLGGRRCLGRVDGGRGLRRRLRPGGRA